MLSPTFPARPLEPTTYDGLVILEVALRLPLDAPPGGEIRVVRTRAGAPLGAPLHIALEPGEPEQMPVALSAALEAWVLGLLAARNLLPITAPPAPRPVPPAAPTAPPAPPLGTLG